MKEIKRKLKIYQDDTQDNLSKTLKKYISLFSKTSEFSGLMGHNLSGYVLRGGKRLRSALIYYTYDIYKKNRNKCKQVMKLSQFIELIHTFLIIHDDIMDRDSLRRGGRAMHILYEDYAKEKNVLDIKHFGESMAILQGDLAYMLGIEMLYRSNISDLKKVEIMHILTKQLISTVFGQAHDILLESAEFYSENDVLLVQKLKTAKYTFETPMLIGAILANKNGAEAKLLSNFALPAGIAFQIRDDILGMFGDKKKTGKSANSDIKEGKRTLLILKALENATPTQAKIIKRYLGKRDLEQDEADQVRKIVRDTKSLDYSIKLTKKYVDRALKALDKLPNHKSEGWQFLNEVAKYTIIREV